MANLCLCQRRPIAAVEQAKPFFPNEIIHFSLILLYPLPYLIFLHELLHSTFFISMSVTTASNSTLSFNFIHLLKACEKLKFSRFEGLVFFLFSLKIYLVHY